MNRKMMQPRLQGKASHKEHDRGAWPSTIQVKASIGMVFFCGHGKMVMIPREKDHDDERRKIKA
jgi:hypothetical protein